VTRADEENFFAAIRARDIPLVEKMLREHPGLASARCPGDTRLLGVVWSRTSSHDPVPPGDSRSCTALHFAAHHGDAHLAELLLQHGADANARGYENNRTDVTPLVLAAAEGNLATLERLLDHGADPNFTNDAGVTPLSAALDEKSIERAQFLVARGAKPGLHEAVKLGLTERVVQLLQPNPDLARQADRHGRTPLDTAAEWGQSAVADVLLQHGVELTPRAAAAFGILEPLLTFHESDPQLPRTANLLTTAAINGQVAAIEFLLSHGADPNERDSDNATPLHNVAMSVVRPQCATSVVPLLRAGADPSYVHRGHTPLQRARQQGNDAVADALLQIT
jgi:ankyrin repeat protein